MTAIHNTHRHATKPHYGPVMTKNQLAYLAFVAGSAWGATLCMWWVS